MASNNQGGKEHPTMIIPKGTEIRVNEKGQLSIKTPGNLVIRNSGHYSLIQSENGSIRVEANVNVEAIEIEAADTCYVLGKLTAWRVKADKLALENGAEAYIMLRESDGLQVSPTARLVGNFASEREVYLLLAKFANQLKSLPQNVPVNEESPRLADRTERAVDKPPPVHGDDLQLARVILDRELKSEVYDEDSRQALFEIHHAVEEGNIEKLRQIFQVLAEQIKEPSRDLEKAFEFIRKSL